MSDLPSISELAGYAASPDSRPSGWLPLSDVVAPLDIVVERMVETAGHCHALYRITGPQPHALTLGRRFDGLGEASFFFTDREAAWTWAESLGPEHGDSVSDCYQSSVWYKPKGHAPAVEVSVHEFDSDTGPDAWVMVQCVCPTVGAPHSNNPRARA